MSTLVDQLRALARFEHSDASIAADAADEIERLAALVVMPEEPSGAVYAAMDAYRQRVQPHLRTETDLYLAIRAALAKEQEAKT
jgi:hypothetical protein